MKLIYSHKGRYSQVRCFKESYCHLQGKHPGLRQTNPGFLQCTNLKHVEEDVEFDDGLAPDQMVHHGHVHIVHDDTTRHKDESLQQVTHLRRLQQPALARHAETQAGDKVTGKMSQEIKSQEKVTQLTGNKVTGRKRPYFIYR